MIKAIFQWLWPPDFRHEDRIHSLEIEIMDFVEELNGLADHVEDHCERLEWCHTHIEALFDALGGSKQAPIDPRIN